MKHIFIIGSKGIPARYGGYETFVEKLTSNQVNKNIKYHVACLSNGTNEFTHNNARCFGIKVPNIGPAKAIFYDVKAFKYCLTYIKKHNLKKCIIYVLTCRVGPFYKKLVKKAHKLDCKVFLNPDGHEWLRAKWPKPVRKYWKYSEKKMIKHSDLIICDSINIENYVIDRYKKYKPNTTYIAYGADLTKSSLKNTDNELISWYKKFNIKPNSYFLSVGRFVPENNFEVMIREFMKSNTDKDFVLITNVEENKLYKCLQEKYHFEKDPRIKFVGTVYDAELLKKIRENAFAYFHGHSVGGTNPSLLEALASTKLNLLYDVGFNKECGLDSALYWSDEIGSLSSLINETDKFSSVQIEEYSALSKNRIKTVYSWEYIVSEYEEEFLK